MIEIFATELDDKEENDRIVEHWHTIWKNNDLTDLLEDNRLTFMVWSSGKFLPANLVQAGFFPSNNIVKKNRGDLWREIEGREVIKIKWAWIHVARLW